MDLSRFRLSRAVLDDPDPHFSTLAHAISYYKPAPSRKPVSTNIPPKARMKAFIRRLSTRHNLDRIDELDETDPFETNFHHDGPYEAIATNLDQPSPHPNAHRSKRESDPHPLCPRQHQSSHRLLPPYTETGLSLHLEPGQILQSNTIYTSYASGPAPAPSHLLSQPNTAPTKPVPPRPQSLSKPQTRPHQDPSPGNLQSPQSSYPPAHRERYLGSYAPDHPNRPLQHHRDHGHDAPPYVHLRTPITVVLPPRYESKFNPSGPPRLSQRTPLPSVNLPSPQSQSTGNVVPASRHEFRHMTVHSLGSPHTMTDSDTQSSSSVHLSWIRHLPKRLVMPAPLQLQSHDTPEPLAWQDDLTLHSHAKPATYSQEPRLLRKGSSTFPSSTPIPDHVPISQDDPVQIIGNLSTKSVGDTQGTKKGAHRRRLSKRKNDI